MTTGRLNLSAPRPTRRAAVSAVVAAAAASVLLAGCAADADVETSADDVDLSDWTPEWVDGVLQPLPTGWPEQLTLVNRGNPGSRNDILMRALHEAVNERSPVDVVYGDAPGGGGHSSWTALEMVAAEDDSGGSPMIISISGHVSSLHQEPIEEETGFTFDDLNMLARLEAVPYVVVIQKDAAWGRTWEEFVAYAKANPGELRYTSPPLGGGIDIAMQAILAEAGIPVGTALTQVPLVNLDDGVIAVAAGEGDIAISDAGAVRQHWESGRLDILFTTAQEVMEPWDDDPEVKTVHDLGITQYYQTDLALVLPPDVPEAHKLWWAELLREAHADEEYQESRRRAIPGVELEFWGPEPSQEHAEFLYELTDGVLRELGMHIDQQ